MKYKFSLFTLLVILCVAFSFAQTGPEKPTVEGNSPASKQPSSGQYANAKLTYKIIPSDSNTFGYDIYSGGNLILHQPYRPVMAGKRGFSTRAMAEKVAALIIEKIKQNQMPPAVSKDELKKLGAY